MRPLALEALDPDPLDARLARVGSEPTVWVDGEILTVAVRCSGEAPFLIGTVHERMRAAGEGCWALRLRVPGLARACIEYGVVDPAAPERVTLATWRGPRAAAEAAREAVAVREPETIAGSEIAVRHPVRWWSHPNPRALVICADGGGLAAWAGVVAAAGEPVALVGIESAGLQFRFGDGRAYDPTADPRARAYLPDVDPAYFAAHMEYVLGDVVPWAEARVGRLPRIVFGVSNGAAWAAAAGAANDLELAGVLAFSLGTAPARAPRAETPAHALVAGQLEPGFHDTTRRYAWRLRARGVPVRLRRPRRGHDSGMWRDEFVPALRWVRRP